MTITIVFPPIEGRIKGQQRDPYWKIHHHTWLATGTTSEPMQLVGTILKDVNGIPTVVPDSRTTTGYNKIGGKYFWFMLFTLPTETEETLLQLHVATAPRSQERPIDRYFHYRATNPRKRQVTAAVRIISHQDDDNITSQAPNFTAFGSIVEATFTGVTMTPDGGEPIDPLFTFVDPEFESWMAYFGELDSGTTYSMKATATGGLIAPVNNLIVDP